jgi:hypothetical protein
MADISKIADELDAAKAAETDGDKRLRELKSEKSSAVTKFAEGLGAASRSNERLETSARKIAAMGTSATELARLTESLTMSHRFPSFEYSGIRSALGSISPSLKAMTRFESVFAQQSDLLKSINAPYEGLLGKWSRTDFGIPADTLSAFSRVGTAFSDSGMAKTMAAMQQIHQYHIPEFDQITALSAQIAKSLDVFSNMPSLRLAETFSNMQNPWAALGSELVSATAIAKMQSIGDLLATQQSFGQSVADVVRHSLGDFRDNIVFSDNLLDYEVRTTLYRERGFDGTLTDFTDEAFEEAVDETGLSIDLPEIVAAFGEPVAFIDVALDEISLYRAEVLYGLLLRFEARLREFIDEAMTAAFGPKWPHAQLPNRMYDRWVDARSRDPYADLDPPLIRYADFTDYVPLICRQDNWKRIFRAVFGREELVRESFQRLHAPRVATMHARPLGREDSFMTYVEIKRFARLMPRGK